MACFAAFCCSACLPFISISLLYQCLPLRLMHPSTNSRRHMINILVTGRSRPRTTRQPSSVSVGVYEKMLGEAWLCMSNFRLKSIWFVKKISCLELFKSLCVSIHPFISTQKRGNRRAPTQLGIRSINCHFNLIYSPVIYRRLFSGASYNASAL